uniref:Uncharacterized protein n=1 Tax=Romanomermis culicivorax TaxID=13658 RepID=A0A915L226_ROMCU
MVAELQQTDATVSIISFATVLFYAAIRFCAVNGMILTSSADTLSNTCQIFTAEVYGGKKTSILLKVFNFVLLTYKILQGNLRFSRVLKDGIQYDEQFSGESRTT